LVATCAASRPVGRLERLERLDEERLPGRAGVVDDPRDLALELGLDRDHVAAVAHGDDRVLDRLRVAGRAHQRAGAVARLVLRLDDPAPDAAQRRRGAVEDAGALVDRVLNPVDDLGQRAERRAARAQQREVQLGLADRAHGRRARRERVGDRSQLARRQRDAARRVRDRLVDRVDRLQPESRLRESTHLAGLADQDAHQRRIGTRLAGQRPGLRAGAVRLPRIALANTPEVEHLEGSLIG